MMREDGFCILSVGWSLKGALGGLPLGAAEVGGVGVFCRPFKNFGRLDASSRAVCEALACVLRGAGLYPSESKLDIPVFFSCAGGSVSSDLAYYRDFLEFGGTAGRANLFLYTLPTSPLGEASVHFGLTGGLAFISHQERPLGGLLDAVSDSCEIRKTGGGGGGCFIVGLVESSEQGAEAVFLLLCPGGDPSEGIQFPELYPEMDFCALKRTVLAIAGDSVGKVVR